jgi:hypothetical protein
MTRFLPLELRRSAGPDPRARRAPITGWSGRPGRQPGAGGGDRDSRPGSPIITESTTTSLPGNDGDDDDLRELDPKPQQLRAESAACARVGVAHKSAAVT